MKTKKIDLIRIIFAEIFFLLAFFWLPTTWSIVFYVLSTIMLIASITGFCGLYKILKINTNKNTDSKISKIFVSIFVILFVIIAMVGSYYSNLFTKKFFLEDYNRMNNYYKQTLFYTGQDKRVEAIDNYNKLVKEYDIFNDKYQNYHPYVISKDKEFNSDLDKVLINISSLKNQVNTGDLKIVHLDLEQIRPIFQDILKRNNFSMLAVYLVDFHDAMEKVIIKADEKDSAGVIEVYTEVSDKLKTVENVANDAEIQLIRQKLDETLNLAKEGKVNELSLKAAELKTAFVKVYLKRG
jgi:phosphate/sulfate permease